MKISLNVHLYLTKRRQKLIDMVQNQKLTVVKASKKLELKVCTARSILTKWTKKGVIYNKKMSKYGVAKNKTDKVQ